MSEISSDSIRLPLGKLVLGVELFDMVAWKHLRTFMRSGSRCTFVERIEHERFVIGLRIDWGDEREGEPVLDMDVDERTDTGYLKRLRPALNPAHHTTKAPAQPDSDVCSVYDLQFEGLHLRLVAKTTFAFGVGLSAYIVDPSAGIT